MTTFPLPHQIIDYVNPDEPPRGSKMPPPAPPPPRPEDILMNAMLGETPGSVTDERKTYAEKEKEKLQGELGLLVKDKTISGQMRAQRIRRLKERISTL